MAKRISIETITDEANKYLLNSPQMNTEGRKAVASFLETMLHKANSYNGFRYTTWEERVDGKDLCGILPNHNGAGQHEFPDETRRQYY
jgi:hypothetical protein